MHVAVVGLRGIPDVMGGIESHCAHLLPRLVDAAPPGQMTITVLGRRGYVAKQGRYQGVEQIALWAPRHPALETIVHSVVALFHARFVLRADCVHLHGIGPGLTAPLARLLGLSLLFTHHGEDYQRKKWGRLSKFALRLGEVFAVSLAFRVITVSQSSANRLKQRFPRRASRVVHIPNGVPSSESSVVTAQAPKDLDVSPGQYIITVGRLVPEKGHDVLIEAYRQAGLSNRKTPCKLLIVGAADHQSSYADSLVGDSGDGVIFAGRLQRDEVMALNRKAALFVLPSYHEGLSIAALEAVRSGAPILLSDIQANRDIGLPAHHYFKTGSVQALAEKLKAPPSKFAAPERFDLDAFNWDRIARQTLEQIASIRRRGAPLLRLPVANEADHA